MRATCFGPWLALEDTTADPLLLRHFLQCEIDHESAGEHGMCYDVSGHIHRYGREEFCLITGFRFGEIPIVPRCKRGILYDRIKGQAVTCADCGEWVKDVGLAPNSYSDDEAVRIALLAMVSVFFLGLQGTVKLPQLVLDLVEDLEAWNNFPWGSYLWDVVYKQMKGAIRRRSEQHRHALTLTGFLFPFKVSYLWFIWFIYVYV